MIINTATLKVAIVAGFAMLVTTTPTLDSFAARGTTVKNNKIIINGVKYRRKTAHDALLGRSGQARGMQMDFKENAPTNWLKNNVKKGSVIDLNSKLQKQLNASAAIKKANLNAKLGISESREAKLQLQFFTINSEAQIVNAINGDPRVRQRLNDYGAKARIVTGIWVLIDGNELSNRCGNGNLSVDTGSNGSYSLSGSRCSENAYSFSADTVMAYEISKIKWRKSRVTGLKMDKMEF
jgi:hypothetical protein